MEREPLGVAEADAVVIGAGAFGLATGYQLARLGAGRVVVLDAFAPGTQSSGRAAGLFKQIQADETLTRLAALSIDIVANLAAEAGVPAPVVRSGSILAARTPAHAAMIRREAEAARAWGVELETIDGAEARRRAPYLRGAGLLVACHIPGDVYVEEPRSLLEAYRRGAERLGARVIGHAPATAIRLERGRAAAVVTPRGEIRTPTVVDSAGAWVKGVGALAGTAVPVATLRHQLAITHPIAGIAAGEPIARLIDASAYVRPCRGGLLFGGFEADPLPFDPVAAGPGTTMDDVPLDTALLGRFASDLADQVAALPDVPLAETRGGAFTMTPDGRFLAGPVSGVDGFWLASGCNGSGFSLGSGIGRLLAEWIVGGEPSGDMSAFDPRRFAAPLSEEELLAAGAFRYANYYTPPEVA